MLDNQKARIPFSSRTCAEAVVRSAMIFMRRRNSVEQSSTRANTFQKSITSTYQTHTNIERLNDLMHIHIITCKYDYIYSYSDKQRSRFVLDVFQLKSMQKRWAGCNVARLFLRSIKKTQQQRESCPAVRQWVFPPY